MKTGITFSILKVIGHGGIIIQEICGPEPSVGVMAKLELLVDLLYLLTMKLDMLLTLIF
jgi:hypothetical protein